MNTDLTQQHKEHAHNMIDRLAPGKLSAVVGLLEVLLDPLDNWRDGDHIERWVGSGLLVAERQFRKVIGHRQIPLLLSSMATAVSKKSLTKGAAAA